jgi:alginate O-acetyltransferase complex protein AlgI
MIFNSITFLKFFIIVYSLYWILRKNRNWQNYMLLFASCYFYMAFIPIYVLILAFTIVIDYFAGIYLEKLQGRNRKWFLVASLIANLGILAFFKYYNFLNDNLSVMLGQFGYPDPIPHLNIILPIGLSFHTFQAMNYTIEIYRGHQKAEHNFGIYALFVMFFPQLVAGPIERAGNLLHQFTSDRKVDWEDVKISIFLIVWGYFLKVFVADNLADIVDKCFAVLSPKNSWDVVVGTYAFAFQIFGDFAGYSSIAIGIARLMGFRLMTNFLYPYFVTNPSDFWKHWHISLSSWLRDYLYISMGGNRKGELLTYRNLFLTMVLGGLWHGAAWTFIIWGTYQGLILIIYRFLSRKIDLKKFDHFRVVRILKIIFMFQFTCLGWLIFRATSLQQLINYTKALFINVNYTLSGETIYYFKMILFYSSIVLFIQYIQRRTDNVFFIYRLPKFVQVSFYVLLLFIILTWGSFGSREFIYFQF